MAINGNICIFRDGSETSVSDKVEFDTSPTNGASTQPDARSHIDNFKVVLSLVAQENPNPDSDNPNSLQDTGLAIVEYEISGYFDASGGTPAAIEDIRDWMTNPKTTASKPLGRFGIRNDGKSQYNVTPASTYGLILEHFEIQDDEEYTAKTAFIIRLRYNGAISGLGA
jgi:hypothetical protein